MDTYDIFAISKRVMGIEPTYLAWKASVLPLNYTRIKVGVTGFEPAASWSQTRRSSQTEPHPVILFSLSYFPDDKSYYIIVIPICQQLFLNFLKNFLKVLEPLILQGSAAY